MTRSNILAINQHPDPAPLNTPGQELAPENGFTDQDEEDKMEVGILKLQKTDKETTQLFYPHSRNIIIHSPSFDDLKRWRCACSTFDQLILDCLLKYYLLPYMEIWT